MCQIAIVANRETLAQRIRTALPENTGCVRFSISDMECKSACDDFSPPDLLIFDLEALTQSLNGLVERLNRINPNVTVIAIVSAENSRVVDKVAPFGIDEVIIRPADEQQMCRMIERFMQRISTFDRLQTVQEKLRQEMRQSQIVAKSKPMREILQRLPQLAACKSTVLITGETGTGKELFARAIHYLGPRAGQPFITVDCGALPDHLVENELFGHVRGAYTDAGASSKGLIQEADGGTLFLDEVEALPFAIQAKFLRFLQERQFKPLGQPKYVAVDVRVLAASNIDLAQAVEKKFFREDLYYRLNVIPLLIPPLRKRKADIPALVHFFLQQYARDRQTFAQFPDEILQVWMEYDWPGNVRELENKLQDWLTGSSTNDKEEGMAFSGAAAQSIRPLAEARKDTLAQFERMYLQRLLAQTRGNISAAARLAETDRKHLRALLKKHGIEAHGWR